MKAQMFKKGLFSLLFYSLIAFPVLAEGDEVKKDFHKEFDVNDNTKLILKNKYGNVDIKDWEKNIVSIDVVITVEHSNKATAEKLLSYIDIELKQEGDDIIARTIFDNKFNSGDWSRGHNGKKYSIDYTVNMPKHVNIDLSNKYGDTFISELTGQALIQIKYGNLKANKIIRGDEKPISKVVLAYGKGSIEEAVWLKLDVKYCGKGIIINQARALVIMSGYSKVIVDNASSIVVDSKYDNYTIGNVNNFVTTSEYTGYQIEQVAKKLNLENKYGNCTVKNIPASFEEIDINSKYGTVALGIEDGASYKIKGEAGYGKIEYPSGGKLSRIVSNHATTVEGIVGNDDNPTARVTILSKYGSVKLVK